MEAHMASACWRDVYLSLGLGMLVPMALLALLLLEGGAVELGFALDSSATESTGNDVGDKGGAEIGAEAAATCGKRITIAPAR